MTSAEIIHNHKISDNGMAGIKLTNKAHAIIKSNFIGCNTMQGVLITETSSAFVEKNMISNNLKANIAYGGEN